jgi:transposase
MNPKRSKYEIVFKNLFFFTGYKLSDLKDTENQVLVILRKVGPPKCSHCGSVHGHIEERYTRIVRELNLRHKQCYIEFEENKIRCSCGYRGIEYLDFIRPYSRCTKYLEDAVATCRMTISDASALWDLDWKTVKEIDMKSIQDKMIDLKTLNPTMIGVDEIAYMKGHLYLTIVRDITARRVIWIGFKRKTETLDEFFKELGPEKSKHIGICCMDMWDPYIASVKRNIQADIVFDKFHIIKKVNEALDKVRKSVFAQSDKSTRKEMKHKRFLILHRRKNIIEEEDIESLEHLLESNKPLYMAYVLKEEIADIFDDVDESRETVRLEQWFKTVDDSGIEEFIPVVSMIQSYLYGILNYFKHRLTNAGSEGFNNKINVIKRAAFGFRDIEYFKLKIFQRCGGFLLYYRLDT